MKNRLKGMLAHRSPGWVESDAVAQGSQEDQTALQERQLAAQERQAAALERIAEALER